MLTLLVAVISAQTTDPKYAPAAEGALPQASILGEPLTLGATVSTEWQVRTQDKSGGAFYDRFEQPAGLARYENTLKLKLAAHHDEVSLTGDLDLDWLGYGDDRTVAFEDLDRRERLLPMRFEAHALYLEITNLGVNGLDLRLGQQVVQWGVADQFNPTNTVNPNDLENVRRFGLQVATPMARIDYALPWVPEGLFDWSLTGVLVPIFRPAVLPHSAQVGASRVDRVPFVDEYSRLRFHSERELAEAFGQPTIVAGMQATLPRPRLTNMPWALRLGGAIGEHDVGFSYYRGRSDIPQPSLSHTEQSLGAQCNPDDDSDCIEGLLQTTVTLAYPRMQVLGFNAAGETPFLPLGYRFELGVYLPATTRTRVTSGEVTLLGFTQPAGEYTYATPDGQAPIVVENQPFAKWTLGLDYSLGSHVYLNGMWVHGLPDEFGAGDFLHAGWAIRQANAIAGSSPLVCAIWQNGESCVEEIVRPRLGDYLVIGADFRFHDTRALARLFTIVDLSGYTQGTWDAAAEKRKTEHWGPLTEDGFSATLYPELAYALGNGVTLSAGALLLLGKDYTRFGDPAAGGSLVFVNGTYQH